MADDARQQANDLSDSVTNMSTQLVGGPAAGAAMVVKGVANKIHEVVGRMNSLDTTDGSKSQPTAQGALKNYDWSKLMTQSNNKGRVNK